MKYSPQVTSSPISTAVSQGPTRNSGLVIREITCQIARPVATDATLIHVYSDPCAGRPFFSSFFLPPTATPTFIDIPLSVLIGLRSLQLDLIDFPTPFDSDFIAIFPLTFRNICTSRFDI